MLPRANFLAIGLGHETGVHTVLAGDAAHRATQRDRAVRRDQRVIDMV